MIKLCPSCGHENPIHLITCQQCPADLTEVAPTVPEPVEDLHDSRRTVPPGQGSDELPEFLQEQESHIPFDEGFVAVTQASTDIRVFLSLPSSERIDTGDGTIIGRGARGVIESLASEFETYRQVSRAHAWVGRVGNTVVLVDLGSKNGTFVDNIRLPPGEALITQIHDLPITIRLGKQISVSVDALTDTGEAS
jgi:hypothetical protein